MYGINPSNMCGSYIFNYTYTFCEKLLTEASQYPGSRTQPPVYLGEKREDKDKLYHTGLDEDGIKLYPTSTLFPEHK